MEMRNSGLYVKSIGTEIKIDPVKKIKFKWHGNTYEIEDVTYYVCMNFDGPGYSQVKKIFSARKIYSEDVGQDYERAMSNPKTAEEVAEMFCQDIKNNRKTYLYDGIIKCVPEFVDGGE